MAEKTRIEHLAKYAQMKIYYYFIFLLFACSVGTDLSGDYSSRLIPYSVILNKDSTFSYRYKFTFDYEYSFGKWSRLNKNTIVLISHFKEKLLLLKVQQSKMTEGEKSNLSIKTPDLEREYYECLIFVNDFLYTKEKCDSIISISIKEPIENFYLGLTADRKIDPLLATRALDTLYTEKFISKPSMYGKYEVEIIYNDSLFNYKVFNHETIKVTRKGLKFYDYRRKKRETIPKKNDLM